MSLASFLHCIVFCLERNIFLDLCFSLLDNDSSEKVSSIQRSKSYQKVCM